MHDKELVREILRQILGSTQTIARRFSYITSADDFTSSDEGMEKLDAICMQLIAIGESVKHLDRITDGALLNRYPAIEWKRIMGMRDVISHHYFDLDAETVYAVCASHLPALSRTIDQILADIDS
jgi:uncharacterized protein with HEPN domain